ncbi:hypothetical protein ASC95_27730 [Pelomonas sp. Root1217]|uniref:hypothetical protein n=1 Tax=Pelomonas sp. Root1217 TaxID=1736430 RepID=UPI00070FF819|nr:hypothetical protein [Pelomonas sp. Root1217]KQV45803.1 hypothetical protein ASC95_27730 [Pelomonas sp. Root1217]
MTSSLVPKWLLKLLDLVPRSDSLKEIQEAKDAQADAEAEADAERKKRWEVERRLEKLIADKSRVDRSLKLSEWMASHLVDFYSSSELPQTYIDHTLRVRKEFVPLDIGGKLHEVDGYLGGSNVAGLFWALTHASKRAYDDIRRLLDENTSTLKFVEGLKEEIATAQRLLGADLQVGVGQILSHRVPALKEASVGADLLLLISGSGLVPDGGVRLFWIQFKLADTPKSLKLDVYRNRNAKNQSQFEALTAVHRPARGSYSLYALGSSGYPFYSAIPVSHLRDVNPDDPATCKVDLGKNGLRFQELMVYLAAYKQGALATGNSGAGHAVFNSFVNETDVLQFVDAAASEQSIVPLSVLGVASGDELVNSKKLVKQIAAAWDRRLDEYVRSQPSADRPDPSRPGPRRPAPGRGGWER